MIVTNNLSFDQYKMSTNLNLLQQFLTLFNSILAKWHSFAHSAMVIEGKMAHRLTYLLTKARSDWSLQKVPFFSKLYDSFWSAQPLLLLSPPIRANNSGASFTTTQVSKIVVHISRILTKAVVNRLTQSQDKIYQSPYLFDSFCYREI